MKWTNCGSIWGVYCLQPLCGGSLFVHCRSCGTDRLARGRGVLGSLRSPCCLVLVVAGPALSTQDKIREVDELHHNLDGIDMDHQLHVVTVWLHLVIWGGWSQRFARFAGPFRPAQYLSNGMEWFPIDVGWKSTLVSHEFCRKNIFAAWWLLINVPQLHDSAFTLLHNLSYCSRNQKWVNWVDHGSKCRNSQDTPPTPPAHQSRNTNLLRHLFGLGSTAISLLYTIIKYR